MFTEQQTDAIARLLDFLVSMDLGEAQPIRYSIIPDDLLAEVEYDQRATFGDGTIAYVGAVDPDLDGCECGNLHVRYTTVRADGAMSPPVTSGTFEETLLGPPVLWADAVQADPDMFAI